MPAMAMFTIARWISDFSRQNQVGPRNTLTMGCAILVCISLQCLQALRPFWITHSSKATSEATGHCHWASTRSMSPQWPPGRQSTKQRCKMYPLCWPFWWSLRSGSTIQRASFDGGGSLVVHSVFFPDSFLASFLRILRFPQIYSDSAKHMSK